MSPEEAERRHKLGPTLLLSVLIVIGFALRVWRLGNWGLDSDETFTLRDSLNPRLDNPRPLLYFLNHYLVPFEVTSLVLLVAAVGAVVLAKRAVQLERGR